MKNKKISNTKKVVAVSAGVAAIGIMSYLLLGPSGKKNQKKIKGWMLKMKGEVMERIENAQEVSEEMYDSAIDEVAGKYKTLKNIDSNDLIKEISALKRGWKAVVSKGKKKIATGVASVGKQSTVKALTSSKKLTTSKK